MVTWQCIIALRCLGLALQVTDMHMRVSYLTQLVFCSTI